MTDRMTEETMQEFRKDGIQKVLDGKGALSTVAALVNTVVGLRFLEQIKGLSEKTESDDVFQISLKLSCCVCYAVASGMMMLTLFSLAFQSYVGKDLLAYSKAAAIKFIYEGEPGNDSSEVLHEDEPYNAVQTNSKHVKVCLRFGPLLLGLGVTLEALHTGRIDLADNGLPIASNLVHFVCALIPLVASMYICYVWNMMDNFRQKHVHRYCPPNREENHGFQDGVRVRSKVDNKDWEKWGLQPLKKGDIGVVKDMDLYSRSQKIPVTLHGPHNDRTVLFDPRNLELATDEADSSFKYSLLPHSCCPPFDLRMESQDQMTPGTNGSKECEFMRDPIRNLSQSPESEEKIKDSSPKPEDEKNTAEPAKLEDEKNMDFPADPYDGFWEGKAFAVVTGNSGCGHIGILVGYDKDGGLLQVWEDNKFEVAYYKCEQLCFLAEWNKAKDNWTSRVRIVMNGDYGELTEASAAITDDLTWEDASGFASGIESLFSQYFVATVGRHSDDTWNEETGFPENTKGNKCAGQLSKINYVRGSYLVACTKDGWRYWYENQSKKAWKD